MEKTCITTDIENSFGYLVILESEFLNECFMNNKRQDISEIFVIYSDGSRERIWSFNPLKYDFDHKYFIGKTKNDSSFFFAKFTSPIMRRNKTKPN